MYEKSGFSVPTETVRLLHYFWDERILFAFLETAVEKAYYSNHFFYVSVNIH